MTPLAAAPPRAAHRAFRWRMGPRLALALAGAVALLGTFAPARADTIYLVNGRTIHTASVRVEDDRVVFSQFGGRVSIPLDQVLRIVDDDEVERRAADGARTGRATLGTAPGSSGGADRPPGSPLQASDAGAASTAASSKAAYWIDRIERIDVNIARVRAALDRLPEYSETDRRLFRFSGQIRYFVDERAKWQRLMDTFQRQRRSLLEGARKAGIAPGSLRDGLRR